MNTRPAYPTDLTGPTRAQGSRLIPAPKLGGRPATLERREVVDQLDAAPPPYPKKRAGLDPDGRADFDPIETVIRPNGGWIAINWGEMYNSRELFFAFMLRDIKIRYKQTVLGVAWALIQPFFTMIVFTVIFGRLVRVDTGGVPYPIFALAALVPWAFFSNAVSASGLSLLTQQNMLTKIYFPRLFVPAATIGGFLLDLAIGLGLTLVVMPFYGYWPGPGLLALPLLTALIFAATLGVGLVLAAMTLLYRDLRFVIPFMLQIGMYVSPVIFRADQLSRPIQLAAALNPMFGIINAFRSALLGTPLDPATLAISIASSAVLLLFGLFFFRKTERLIADIA